tara:strand:- start:303 stop:488 length:186 start_codon:yes stop_codon:yes gene_type:complete
MVVSATITNAKYGLDPMTGENTCINCVFDGRHVSVPLNAENTEYIEIMRQVDNGDLVIEKA